MNHAALICRKEVRSYFTLRIAGPLLVPPDSCSG